MFRLPLKLLYDTRVEHLKTLTSKSKLLLMKDPFKDVNRKGHSGTRTHDTQKKKIICLDESLSGMDGIGALDVLFLV